MNKNKIIYLFITLMSIVTISLFTGCERDIDLLEPATSPVIAEVFIDGFSSGLEYGAFGGSKVTAFTVDEDVTYTGKMSMRVDVPNLNDPNGSYAGGAYYTTSPRDLSSFNVLTFYAKASQPAKINVLGLGNDLSGTSQYSASITDVQVNSFWQKYYIPIPDPSKLTSEKGMFFFSEGPEDELGYSFWIDEVKFEKNNLIVHPRGTILEGQDQEAEAEVGDVLQIGGTYVIFNMPDGTDMRVEAQQGYFNFTSSDQSVITVSPTGQLTAVDTGTAVITAKLGDSQANGSIKVTVGEAAAKPQVAAPAPTQDAADVISLFSNVYNDVTVDAWATYWEFSTTTLTETQINGDDVKLYKKLNFNGIEFVSQQVNASSMTRFHMDIWTPDATDMPAEFKILLVDFGPDGAFDGGDDASHEITFTANTDPGLKSNEWVSIDVPLSDFVGLTSKANLAQMVISGDPNTVYVDNVYFYDDGTQVIIDGPDTPAPTPTVPASDVISLFSDAYSDVTVDAWATYWEFSTTTLTETNISGDAVKLYQDMNFNGIEFVTEQVDATEMTRFHMDIWTPDPTSLPAEFKVQLVDFGANGVYDGGDDSSHELVFTASTSPAISTDQWVSIDVPLSAFTNLTSRKNLAQMVISGDPNTVYVDNVYFYKDGSGGGGTEPTTAAPAPAFTATNVISLFSNEYSNVQVDTWSTDWDVADLTETTINGDDVKLYTNLSFAGIETVASPVDATGMTHFYINVWTPDATEAPAVFKIKLVDFGADGAFQGGDDVEHELSFHNTTTPAMATGSWVTLDIPLSDFAGLTTKGHIAQIIISGDPNTVYVDNMLFHK